MDTRQNNIDRSEMQRLGGTPSKNFLLIMALIAAASAVLMPELGLISLIALSAAVAFITSSKANFLYMLIPVLGIGGAYFRGGLYAVAICSVIALAGLFSGLALRRHGFFRALLTYTLVVYGLAVAAVAVYTRIYDISATALLDYYRAYFAEIFEASAATYSETVPQENVAQLTEMYELTLDMLVAYASIIPAWIIELCGVAALRLVGLFHNMSGSRMYPLYKRFSYADRVFAVLFSASLLLGFIAGGVVGICAENVVLILMIPAVCAGVSSIRLTMAERRIRGMRGLPISLVIVLVSVFISPVTGLLVLGFTGALDAFKKKRPPQR